jgi:hypothetical protein
MGETAADPCDSRFGVDASETPPEIAFFTVGMRRLASSYFKVEEVEVTVEWDTHKRDLNQKTKRTEQNLFKVPHETVLTL